MKQYVAATALLAAQMVSAATIVHGPVRNFTRAVSRAPSEAEKRCVTSTHSIVLPNATGYTTVSPSARPSSPSMNQQFNYLNGNSSNAKDFPISTRCRLNRVIVTVTEYTTVTPTPLSTNTVDITRTVTKMPSSLVTGSDPVVSGPTSPVWYSGPNILPSTSSMRRLASKSPASSGQDAVPTLSGRPLPTFSTNSTLSRPFSAPNSSIHASRAASHSNYTTKPVGTAHRNSMPLPKTHHTSKLTFSSATKSVGTPHRNSAPLPSSTTTPSTSPAVVVIPIHLSGSTAVVSGLKIKRTMSHLSTRNAQPTILNTAMLHTIDVREAHSSNTDPINSSATKTFIAARSTPAAQVSSKPNPPSASKKSHSTNAPKPTTSPRSHSESLSSVKTVIVPEEDPRCPYPYPGVHCGGGSTTLSTGTKKASSSGSETRSDDQPKSTGYCPYPYPGGKGEEC